MLHPGDVWWHTPPENFKHTARTQGPSTRPGRKPPSFLHKWRKFRVPLRATKTHQVDSEPRALVHQWSSCTESEPWLDNAGRPIASLTVTATADLAARWDTSERSDSLNWVRELGPSAVAVCFAHNYHCGSHSRVNTNTLVDWAATQTQVFVLLWYQNRLLQVDVLPLTSKLGLQPESSLVYWSVELAW